MRIIDSFEISYLIFEKKGKMLNILSSATVVIDTLRIKWRYFLILFNYAYTFRNVRKRFKPIEISFLLVI